MLTAIDGDLPDAPDGQDRVSVKNWDPSNSEVIHDNGMGLVDGDTPNQQLKKSDIDIEDIPEAGAAAVFERIVRIYGSPPSDLVEKIVAIASKEQARSLFLPAVLS